MRWKNEIKTCHYRAETTTPSFTTAKKCDFKSRSNENARGILTHSFQVSEAFLRQQHFYFDETNMLAFYTLWVLFIIETPVKPYLALKVFWHQTGSTSCNHIQNKKNQYQFFTGVIWAYFMLTWNPVGTCMFSFLKAMKNSCLTLWGVDRHWLCLVIINCHTYVTRESGASESWNQARLISHSNRAYYCLSPVFWYYR